jgi:hypothetical protein
MRILPPFEEKIRRQIHDELAKKPLITVMAIKERMEEVFGRGFDYTYIRRLTARFATNSPLMAAAIFASRPR